MYEGATNVPYFSPHRPLNQDMSPRPFPAAAPIVFERADPPKWEYRVVTIDLREEAPLDDERLTALGADGWLLAGLVPVPTRDTLPRVVYYFVRPA
jgi:hypothetical protein